MAEAAFPSNSDKSRANPPVPLNDDRIEKIERLKAVPDNPEPPVFEGKVTLKRKTIGSRLKAMFVQDGGDFVEGLVEGVIIPMAKDIFLTVVRQTGDSAVRSFEQMLHSSGSDRDIRSSSRQPGPISYNNVSRPNNMSIGRGQPVSYRPEPRRSNRLEDIEFDYRSDATKVLMHLESAIEDMGHVTVGDLYDHLDYPMHSTDEKWGWTNMDRAYVSEMRDGRFRLNLPEPVPIHPR